MKQVQMYFYCYLDTAIIDIEECFKGFVKRDDIDIILINQNVSNKAIVVMSLHLI